jgi:hypothetical protein
VGCALHSFWVSAGCFRWKNEMPLLFGFISFLSCIWLCGSDSDRLKFLIGSAAGSTVASSFGDVPCLVPSHWFCFVG